MKFFRINTIRRCFNRINEIKRINVTLTLEEKEIKQEAEVLYKGLLIMDKRNNNIAKRKIYLKTFQKL